MLSKLLKFLHSCNFRFKRGKQNLYLRLLKARMYSNPPLTDGWERVFSFKVRIAEPKNFYILYKDIFVNRIYHFVTDKSEPLILDCGSNIGLSVLYFKYIYPQAKIIAFEPDPILFKILEENIKINNIQNVELVQKALFANKSVMTFYSDGKIASHLEKYSSGNVLSEWQKFEVPTTTLTEYIEDEIDFLKMNIEGAEFDVINQAKEKLKNVRQIVIEYHHQPGLPRTLHKILQILNDCGFEYLISNYDKETNPEAYPPIELTLQTCYNPLIYAKRLD